MSRRGAVGLIVPVKRLDVAKTRLAPAFSPQARAELATAMLLDVLAIALDVAAVDEVWVVTPDDAVAAVAHDRGARVLIDAPVESHCDPLNSAIETADETLRRRRLPNIGVLHGDLAALRRDELIEVLTSAAPHRRSFIADRHGEGTTAAFGFGAPIEPAFGVESARRHRASGAAELIGDWPGMRCDVDSSDDVVAALGYGVGPATLAALRRHLPTGIRSSCRTVLTSGV